MGRMIFLLAVIFSAALSFTSPVQAAKGYSCGPMEDDNPLANTGIFYGLYNGAALLSVADASVLSCPRIGATATPLNAVRPRADGLLLENFLNGGGKFGLNFGTNASNIVLAGATADRAITPTTRQFFINASTAATMNATITFSVGAKRFQFTLTKPAASNIVQGFTIIEAPTANSNVIETTKTQIQTFMQNRAQQVLGNQPSLVDFVSGQNSGGGSLGALDGSADAYNQVFTFSTSGSRILSGANRTVADAFKVLDLQGGNKDKTDGSTAALGYAKANSEGADVSDAILKKDRSGTWDIWTRIYGARSKINGSESIFGVGYLGAHYFLSSNTMIGLIGQVDWTDQDNKSQGSSSDGIGWMVGPYIAGQVSDQPLFYEARFAWGQSENSISPTGAYKDDFSTERWLVNAKVSGSFDYRAYTLSPAVSVSYFEERQNSYTDSQSNVIAAQTLSLGEVKFGPTLSRTFTLDEGISIRPFIGTSGVYNFSVGNSSSQSFAGEDNLRARFDTGLSATVRSGISFRLKGFYDGIGLEDYETYGGSAKIQIPLN